MFPVWLGFKGGKGMATALGVMWGLSWPVGAIACAAWLVFAALFRYSSLATLLSVVVAAIAAWFLTDSRVAMLLTLLVPLVWVRHHAEHRPPAERHRAQDRPAQQGRGRLYFRRVKPSGLQSSLPTPWWTKNSPSGSTLSLTCRSRG